MSPQHLAPDDVMPGEAEPQFEELYEELKQIARARLRRAGPTRLHLNTTALVHESFLRLNRSNAEPRFASSGHFLAYAARVMRSVIIDLAREQAAEQRGGGQADLSLDTEGLAALPGASPEPAVLAVHEALLALQDLEPRLAQVVELRYFGGLSEGEIACNLGLTERTVRRDWQKARALLLSMLTA
ncbi:sigma-70 family RNA polymerase sigma factor [Paucibacter sp. DJ1R-11]|uniref:ECF-type sigma factor n=1 Tax=Paucibacter sp. DJ1R-11 TaxID=2893556 RepID=UPI0021E3E1C3|nr:ECF-type sigma factor [Paucibacter sp. DJ1R-11]MCV2364917.1 sigma-70 family RNA polymerase sigma factor [Paucibacter sp. DJ1R-11]